MRMSSCYVLYHSLGWTEWALDTKYGWLYLPLTIFRHLWKTHETDFHDWHQHLQPHAAPCRIWKAWIPYECYRRYHWRIQATLLLFVQSWRLQWYTWCIALIALTPTPRETYSQGKCILPPCSSLSCSQRAKQADRKWSSHHNQVIWSKVKNEMKWIGL